jgi:hypothetical protein
MKVFREKIRKPPNSPYAVVHPLLEVQPEKRSTVSPQNQSSHSRCQNSDLVQVWSIAVTQVCVLLFPEDGQQTLYVSLLCKYDTQYSYIGADTCREKAVVVLVNDTWGSPLWMHAMLWQTMSRVRFVNRFTPSVDRETLADHFAVSFCRRVYEAKTVNFYLFNVTHSLSTVLYFHVLH